MRGLSYQSRLGNVLHTLFPGHNIIENARKQGGIVAISKRPLELDYWVPDIRLAFEYQDPYHYTTTWYQTRMAAVQERDEVKKMALSSRDETLIIVPYWWDGSADSLIATIIAVRPDLSQALSYTATKLPIPSYPPAHFFEGTLMLASFPDGNVSRDLDAWWLSEKYDGFRGFWNPTNKVLYSRFGLELSLSSKLTTLFVDWGLDGELWFGRGTFLESQKIFKRGQQDDISWHWLRMNVFDVPSVENQHHSIEKRAEILLHNIPSDHPFLIPTSNINSRGLHVSSCNHSQNRNNYHSLLSHVLSDHGEGIILRAPSSPYLPGRSDLWIKIKMLRDQEALVVNVSHDNNIEESSYLLLLADGSTCTATGTQSEIQKNNVQRNEGSWQESQHDVIQRGDIVTFSYTAYNKDSGGPQGCRVMRRRHDLSWQDVLLATNNRIRNDVSKKPMRTDFQGDRKPPGFWLPCDTEHNNMRGFFDDLATSRNLDGTIPENWFSFTKRDILQEKGGASILRHYSSSLRLALAAAYPSSIGLVAEDVKFRLGFGKIPTKFWDAQCNRKQFLHNIASSKSLDPYAFDTWDSISKEDILKEQGGHSFMRYYTKQGQSLMSAISEFFVPGSERNDARSGMRYYQAGRDCENDRKYIKSVATTLGIDTHAPNSWLTGFPIINSIVMSNQSGIELANYYSGVSKAVTLLFPELNLNASSLELSLIAYENQCLRLVKQRDFFEKIALRQCFDPLIPENWYSISLETIYAVQGAKSILKKPSQFISMLRSSFPNLHFVANNFVYIND